VDGLSREETKHPSFDDWLREVSPTWRWDWPHLIHIRCQLDRVTRGEIARLMVFLPPRHGKSEQGTIRYPVWRLENNPSLRVIIGAYNQTLAEKFSRKARRLAVSRFPLARDRKAVDDWETLSGGGVRAVGVGGGVTGQGGDLILIDDPVKSREEAESEAYRDRVWDWYTDDLYTRQEPGAAIVLTTTRWHEDDLAGRILKSSDAPSWTVICLPALAEADDPLGRPEGAALCPERYDVATLESIKAIQGRSFYALYQQRPVPESGGRFKREWFLYWESCGVGLIRLHGRNNRSDVMRLSECRRFATVDSAVSLKTSADYTVISLWAVSTSHDLVLLDRIRGRMDDPTAVNEAVRISQVWKSQHLPISYFGLEANGVGKPRAQNMRARGLPVREIDVQPDKIARSSTAVVRCEAGQIFWPMSALWLAEWEAEHLSFPAGEHDDQVDTTSLAAQDVFAPIETFSPGTTITPSYPGHFGRQLPTDTQRAADRWLNR
jgi:predicted phage terminase large subunit-like protein